VTSTAIKHVNKGFLSKLGDFFPHFSLWVEVWLWARWVVSFGGFDCFLLLVIVGARDELMSTLHTIVLTTLKINTQLICGLGCTLLNMTQINLNHFLTHNQSLKMRSQVGNLLLYLSVLFGSMEKLALEGIKQCSKKNDQACA
jgi:uncharacterized membrane protein